MNTKHNRLKIELLNYVKNQEGVLKTKELPDYFLLIQTRDRLYDVDINYYVVNGYVDYAEILGASVVYSHSSMSDYLEHLN